MAEEWDREVDVLVAGTGAAGMSAAIAAKDSGSEVLVVESTPYWGGTTSWSGGGVWAPVNRWMLADGAEDSPEKALLYMETVIADVGPATSRGRKQAFIRGVNDALNLLADNGVIFTRAKEYPDYYPDKPGGMVGRSLEVTPFDVRRLGPWWKQAQNRQGGLPLAVKTDDIWLLTRAFVTWSGFWRGVELVFRVLGGLVSGKNLRGMGGALTSAMFKVLLDQGVEVWLESPISDLVFEGGEVVGALVAHGGQSLRVRTRKGVVLGAGGFANRTEWRERYQGVHGWSSAPKSDLGTAIEIAIDHGVAVSEMNDAWWGATVYPPSGEHVGFVLAERSVPHGIIVDQSGSRYLNESESYIDIGHHMLERNKTVPSVPSWLVTDARHKRYLNTIALAGGKAMREAGLIVTAPTLAELATAIKVDPAALAATVERFNGFCATGVDEDFGRGRTVYDNYYGDPRNKPNPNLGTLTKGPFTAYQLMPGDLGTKGGILTDEHARAIAESGQVIPGLYAAGNTTASVMGPTYPGPGSTIGPALAFGYLAGRHAAAR